MPLYVEHVNGAARKTHEKCQRIGQNFNKTITMTQCFITKGMTRLKQGTPFHDSYA